MADPASDGWPAVKVFDSTSCGYTYDDLVFLPDYASFGASEEVNLAGQVTKNIKLNTPVIGGPSDTVTEADMAIALALSGALGIIHANQDIESQVRMVQKVKRHVNGFILEPVTLAPTHSLEDYDALFARDGIGTFPITDTGKVAGKLLGIVTQRDADKFENRDVPLSQVMTRAPTAAKEPLTLEQAIDELKRTKVGKLPILDSTGSHLTSMVSRRDLKKIRDFPNMSKDLQGKLLVGAALPLRPDGSADWPRASALAEAGINVLCLITEGGQQQLDLLIRFKNEYPLVDVLAGPVSSTRDARRLVLAGADGILVGSGCDAGPDPLVEPIPATIGRGDATNVYEVAFYASLNFQEVPIIASGARSASQALIALGLGASAVMLQEPLAGCEEAPGAGQATPALHHSTSLVPKVAVQHKLPRPAERKSTVPRTVATPVASKGSVRAYLLWLLSGLQGGMRDLGFRTLKELHKGLDSGKLRLECRLPYSLQMREACSQMAKQARHPEVMPVSMTAS
eukprot:TRINITY_DN61579_c0_g1_i1.p1 TRINITY_DN61579_c0_g1~~TRINITY_DN61579_c0_g1_i1.p1  ORF type:complete len:513 (-),score=95.05 TRINITY_DN61579_c0_g1_i1:39-1577(-)